MIVRVSQRYSKTKEIEGVRSSVLEATSLTHARHLFDEGCVVLDEIEEVEGDVGTEFGEVEFEVEE